MTNFPVFHSFPEYYDICKALFLVLREKKKTTEEDMSLTLKQLRV